MCAQVVRGGVAARVGSLEDRHGPTAEANPDSQLSVDQNKRKGKTGARNRARRNKRARTEAVGESYQNRRDLQILVGGGMPAHDSSSGCRGNIVVYSGKPAAVDVLEAATFRKNTQRQVKSHKMDGEEGQDEARTVDIQRYSGGGIRHARKMTSESWPEMRNEIFRAYHTKLFMLEWGRPLNVKYKRLEWGRPLNVESRGQGFQSNYFYIYEFVGEDQDAAAAREEEDKE